MVEIESQARRMYDDCPTVKPSWDQLGEITKSVWREQAVAISNRSDGILPTAPAVKDADIQSSLF